MVINELKDICPLCQGMKFTAGISDMGITQINPGGTCPSCNGRGFLLTEKGEDLLELLRPFILEMIDSRKDAKDDAPPAQHARESDPGDEPSS